MCMPRQHWHAPFFNKTTIWTTNARSQRLVIHPQRSAGNRLPVGRCLPSLREGGKGGQVKNEKETTESIRSSMLGRGSRVFNLGRGRGGSMEPPKTPLKRAQLTGLLISFF